MWEPPKSPYLVPFDGSFRVSRAPTGPPDGAPKKKDKKRELAELVAELDSLQAKLNADNRFSVLLVFQAIDAAGKDGTIRAVLTGVNPAGCQVFSFKAPSEEELDHDFLWRVHRAVPERGRIGVLNRSHYEEVIVVRVHPEFLDAQRLPDERRRGHRLDALWRARYESIVSFEQHLARNGTVILKFWLNVSKREQCQRLLDRIEDERANWKFSARDIDERKLWAEYMTAYEHTLRATSRPWAPWYAIPADDKRFMRMCVADIVVRALRSLKLEFPVLSNDAREQLRKIRRSLQAQMKRDD